jgi:hypothetical protein
VAACGQYPNSNLSSEQGAAALGHIRTSLSAPIQDRLSKPNKTRFLTHGISQVRNYYPPQPPQLHPSDCGYCGTVTICSHVSPLPRGTEKLNPCT